MSFLSTYSQAELASQDHGSATRCPEIVAVHASARRYLRNAVHFAIGLAVGAYLAAPVLRWFIEGMPQ